MFRNSVAFLVRQIKSQQRQELIIEFLCAFKISSSNMNMVNDRFHADTSVLLYVTMDLQQWHGDQVYCLRKMLSSMSRMS